MFIELSVMAAVFCIFLNKRPDPVLNFKIVNAIPGEITFHWTPSRGAVSYDLLVYLLPQWTTQILNIRIEYDDNMATFKYTSLVTNQAAGSPNVIFNIRANAQSRNVFRESDKTLIRYELLNL
jgi:hypothetical protein